MKKILFTSISILLLAAACNKQAQVQPVQTIDSKVQVAVETELNKSETPSGSKLLSVKVEGNKITLNFSKEIQSKGQGIFENTFQRISSAIGNGIVQGDTEYVILIEGQPLNEYYKDQETANWKIYTNAKYGFEVKYLSSWVVKEDGPVVFRSLSYQNRLDENSQNCSDNKEQTLCLSEMYGESVTFDAELGDRPSNQLKGQKVFNGITFNKYYDGGLFGNYTIYTTLKNGIVLAFSTDDKNLSYLEQILSTFKFTK